MIILATDSTAKVVTAALCRDEELLGIHTSHGEATHSETLLPAIAALLEKNGMTAADIDMFALSRGPGSFTGVRIGAAVIKGLAFGREKPCVGVSSVEALSRNLRGADGIVCPVMDARRGEVYNALFDFSESGRTRLTPDRAISLEALCTELSPFSGKRKIYLCGDGYGLAAGYFAQNGLQTENTPEEKRAQDAYSVALCALEAYRRGENIYTDRTLFPSYLRLPQAERERLERLGGTGEK